jgi:diacylglycerol kinase family enzyme
MLTGVRQAVLIVNPFASGVTDERVAAVEGALRRVAELRTLRTERPGHAVELVEAVCREGVDAIVVFSGDGGYNEAANGADGQTPLGFVPGGGTSVLARALGLPREPEAAARSLAEAIEHDRTRRITLGRVNGRRFAFTAGIGFDAELVRRVEGLGRAEDGRRAGDLAFARVAAGLLLERRGRFEPALEVDGMGRAAFLIAANCDPFTYAGRMPLRVAPAARFELGLDFVAPRAVRGRDVPRLLAYLATGRESFRGAHVAYAHDVDGFEVVCDRPLPLQADGEDLGDVEEVVFEAEPDVLTVVG